MSDSSKKPDAAPTSLTEDDIVEHAPARRSVLALLSATVLGGAAKALGGCLVANPQPIQTGPQQQGYAQQGYVQQGYVQQQPQTVVVQGGGGYQSGLTDSDSGSYADPVNNGRGAPRGMQTGLTDGDSGTYSDPVNGGRGRYGRGGATGLTDGDAGAGSDPVGNGRGTARLGQTGITDSDSGNFADGVGHGRGRRW
jgi:hypothetical protein